MNNMSKQVKINEAELIQIIASETEFSVAEVKTLLEKIKYYIVDIPLEGFRLHLNELGDFYIQESKARKSNLDGTKIPSMKHLKFKSSITLRRKIND